MDKKWWLVPGIVLEQIRKDNEKVIVMITKMNNDTGEIDFNDGDWWSPDRMKSIKFKPIGVPFDCMPEWAERIEFNQFGLIIYHPKDIYYFEENYYERFKQYCSFPKCPEEWKGKTLLITDELRELINGQAPSI